MQKTNKNFAYFSNFLLFYLLFNFIIYFKLSDMTMIFINGLLLKYMYIFYTFRNFENRTLELSFNSIEVI